MIEDEVTTGSVNPWLPMRTGRARRSRSTLVTVQSIIIIMIIIIIIITIITIIIIIAIIIIMRKKNNNNSNNNNNKKCAVIDVAIPSDKNAFTKVSETTFRV